MSCALTQLAKHFQNGLIVKLRVRLATFYSRSRKGRWCKGETSGHYIKVVDVYLDCDRDSIIYQSEPIGPACHTVAHPPTCTVYLRQAFWLLQLLFLSIPDYMHFVEMASVMLIATYLV